MDMHVGSQIHGFTVRRIRDIPGSSAQLVEMLYEKTQTGLVWHKSRESNKLFNVIFKTLPQDDTGVFHILEHSLLCGSEKYPVKEPFVELMKSTMNTFLNAITFRDKTMYPVASRNEQDFLNLTSVYLDAVFAPRAMEDENIFLQEGWHHELQGDSLCCNGVVFNEMKGAMSSIDQVVDNGIHALLFPDTSYGYNYGGDPGAIPQLTWEHFRESYRQHYHPSNALIYLDGDLPLEKTLEMVEGYLSRYDLGGRRQESYQIPRAAERTIHCEAAPGEAPARSCQLVLGRLMGSWQDKTQLLAARVLCEVLCGSNDAPLKRAILNAGLGQDVSMEVSNWIAQPFITLRVHNMDDANSGAVRSLIRSTLEELVREGLPGTDLLAAIHGLAYRVKDIPDPQPLYRCLDVLGSWLYDGDPMLYLHFDETIDRLKAMAGQGGFEALVRQLLLDESTMAVLHVVPTATHGRDTREAEAARLARIREEMDRAALEALAARNERLHTWQQTPDSPEALGKLPVLDPRQISPESNEPGTRVETQAGVPVLCHDTDTNGIVHLNAYISLTDLDREELTAAGFLCTLLGKLPTEGYDTSSLHNAIRTYLGKLEFTVAVFAEKDRTDRCRPCLVARCSTLRENLPTAKQLLVQILTATQLRHPRRIREILLQARMENQQMAVVAGNTLGTLCARSHLSAGDAAAEAVEGYSRIRWVRDFAENFEDRIERYLSLWEAILGKTGKARLTLSVTADRSVDLSDLIDAFPQGTCAPAGAACESPLPRKLGIRIPAQVSYACTGYHLNRCGESYRGTALLVSNILSLSCLWNSIRVQGGAYGAGMNTDRSGSLHCYSYRDPSPARSLEVYRGMADFVRGFRESGESLAKYIVSTIASTEPLMKPDRLGAEADRLWFCGISHQDLLRERQQLLEATQEDLLAWCPMLTAMARDCAICVVGHADALAACAGEGLTVYSL